MESCVFFIHDAEGDDENDVREFERNSPFPDAVDHAMVIKDFLSHIDNKNHPDKSDENEGRIVENGEFFQDADAPSGYDSESKDTDEDAGTDDPYMVFFRDVCGIVNESDGCDDIVERKRKIHELNAGNGRQKTFTCEFAGGMIFMFFDMFEREVVRSQINQVDCAKPLDPFVVHEPGDGCQSDTPEYVGADEPPAKSRFLLMLGQVGCHGGDPQGIVDRQEAFDED